MAVMAFLRRTAHKGTRMTPSIRTPTHEVVGIAARAIAKINAVDAVVKARHQRDQSGAPIAVYMWNLRGSAAPTTPPSPRG